MKPIKQKGQDFAGYDTNLEALADGLLYNPRNRKILQKNLKSGSYYRLLSGFLPILEKGLGYKLKDFKPYYIAQSHCDASWLWPQVDTKVRIYKTFYKALEHLSLYPYLKFSQTSPQYFQWIKAYSPKMWEQVKEQVKKGRIEPVGGMWVEPDLDLPCGESLVRQRMYGQHFYLREFGFISKIESLLDVFGYNWNLPQILVKSGSNAFWTTKLTWNDYNKWPIANFMWQSPDGSRVFTHQNRFNMMQTIWFAEYYKTGRLPLEGYKGQTISSRNTNAEIQEMLSKDRIEDVGCFYGWGDGARGPWEPEIGVMQLLAQRGYGKHSRMDTFFTKLQKAVDDDYLVWNDEMYLEYHRGCKTTQLEIKHFNRQAEVWAQAAESLLTMLDMYQGGAVTYDKPAMFEMWRKIMFNQFHDILPGSSIPDVYPLAVKEQKDAIKYAQSRIRSILNAMNPNKEEILIFNPFVWSRNEYITIPSESGNTLHYCQNIPPLSITSMKITANQVDPKKWKTLKENEQNIILENEVITAEISKSTGGLISLLYKPLQYEILDISKSRDHLGSGFRVFRDIGKAFPAWNINRKYWRSPIQVHMIGAPQIRTRSDGTPSVVISFGFLKSMLQIEFYLRPNDPIVHMHIHSDVKDPEVLVKYFLPLNFKSEEITAEIPYASIVRKRKMRTEMEKAKWECPMQKWIDISDKDCGLTIVNNNRYGYSASMHGIYLTLTRTPKYPTPGFYSTIRTIPKKLMPKYTDLKPFDYDFGLVPHAKSWKDANTWQLGMNFNLPLIVDRDLPGEVGDVSTITLGPQTLKLMAKPLVTCDATNVMVGTLKPTEWSGKDLKNLPQHPDWEWNHDYVILRIVEQTGQKTSFKLTFNSAIQVKSAELVNLLEMEPKPLAAIQNGVLNLEIGPFEIKTIRLNLTPRQIKSVK